jgi:hypothetical protein
MGTLWTLPVPSTALLDGGPVFEKRLGRDVALRFSYEGEDDARRSGAVVFQGSRASSARTTAHVMLRCTKLTTSLWIGDRARGSKRSVRT